MCQVMEELCGRNDQLCEAGSGRMEMLLKDSPRKSRTGWIWKGEQEPTRWPKDSGHFGKEKSQEPCAKAQKWEAEQCLQGICGMPRPGLNAFIIPSCRPRTQFYNTYVYLRALSQDLGSWSCNESKRKKFLFLRQTIIYTSALHFILPCAGRNPLTNLTQVGRGSIKTESPCVIEGSVTSSTELFVSKTGGDGFFP